MALLINGIDTPRMPFSALTVRLSGSSSTTVQFLPYQTSGSTDPHSLGGETVWGQRIRRLREAIHHIVHTIANYAPANARFSGLPRGRTLAQLITDRPDIIICLDPANFTVLAAAPIVTAAHPSAAEMRLSLTGLCFHRRRASGRSVEATILHELAHLNGAPGGSSTSAEGVLLRSRMGDQFDSHVQG